MDNESWILERGHQIIEKMTGLDIDDLSDLEGLIYLMWVHDYAIRNAGDTATGDELYEGYQKKGIELAKSVGLEMLREYFLADEDSFYDLFEMCVSEIRKIT